MQRMVQFINGMATMTVHVNEESATFNIYNEADDDSCMFLCTPKDAADICSSVRDMAWQINDDD